MSIDLQTLEHLGRLARLATPAQDREALRAAIGRVLDLFAALADAPVDALEPLAHPLDLTLRLRDDAVAEPDRSAGMLALAAETHAGYYLVPRVIEG